MLCNYGCNKEAVIILKNGKGCCSKRTSQCDAVKKRNSQGMKKAYAEGVRVPTFTDIDREKANIKNIEKAAIKLFQINNTPNHLLKRSMITYHNIQEKCLICGISEWRGSKIPLELDHIDGNSSNNILSNLRLLCPNCHSLTNTWKGKNINNGKKRVSDEDLKNAICLEKNIRQALIRVNLTPRGANYIRAYKLKNELDSSRKGICQI